MANAIGAFQFSRQGLKDSERLWQRFFEMLPAATSWGVLIGLSLLAWWKPILAAVLIIAFDLYWLLRLFYMTFFLVLAYVRLSREQRVDWVLRLRALDQRLLSQRNGNTVPCSSEVCHVVIIPVVKELRAVIEPGVKRLTEQRFLSKQLIVVFALEERASDDVKQAIEDLRRDYRHHFHDCLITIHPSDLPGESRVKGANVSYAAKAAASYLTDHGIPFERVVVSCFDADTVVSPDYFACLTYHFLTAADRTQASFQPIPVYHNNIWDAPGFARVLDIGSSFFQLIEATNPEKLVTFSSHSMSFKALVDVGYWPVDMISDDSAIFWKAFIHFKGRYRVIPMYVTVSMDVVDAGSWWSTITTVYRQKRRWAWGIENFPIVMRAFLRMPMIALVDRVRLAFKLFGGHVAWATWPFLLTIVGWLPAAFAGREFSSSVLYYSAPRITAIIFSLASLSLVTSIILSMCLLPKKSVAHPLMKRIAHTIEWACVPIISIALSAIPALDAQTRLLLGKRMSFYVTEKTRRVL
jgi:hypothetical protein